MVIIDRYLLQMRLYINYKGKTIYYTPFTSNCCSCIKKLIFFFFKGISFSAVFVR